MKSLICYGFALGIVVTIGVSSHAETVVTASHTLPPDGTGYFHTGAGMGTDGVVFDNRKAQTFTAEVGGRVQEVSFIARRFPDTTADLRVTITSLADDQPGSVLGTTRLDVDSFMVEDFPPGEPTAFTSVADFSSQGISLAAQSQYAIVFSTDTTEANYRLYGDRLGYAGGEHLRSQNGSPYEPSTSSSDLFFEVTVIAIPEPAAGILAAVATLSLLLAGSIRRGWS